MALTKIRTTNDLLPNYDFLSAKPSNRKQASKRVETQEAGMTYAEEAREKAKRDVREKRQKFPPPRSSTNQTY